MKYHCIICNSKIRNTPYSIKRHNGTLKHIRADPNIYLPAELNAIIISYCSPIQCVDKIYSNLLILGHCINVYPTKRQALYQLNCLFKAFGDLADREGYKITIDTEYVEPYIQYTNETNRTCIHNTLEKITECIFDNKLDEWINRDDCKAIFTRLTKLFDWAFVGRC